MAGGALWLVLYDVTTPHFEAERENKLRKVGMSTERRVAPQVQVGLLVDRGRRAVVRGRLTDQQSTLRLG